MILYGKSERVRSNIPGIMAKIGKIITFENGPRRICQFHYHEEIELLAVYDGVITVAVDDEEYDAGAGDIVFINSGVPHYTKYAEKCTYALIQFRESDFRNSEASSIIKYSARIKVLNESEVRIINNRGLFVAVTDAIDEFDKGETAYAEFVRSDIHRILGHLYRTGILQDAEELYKTKEIQKILPVLSYINDHYNEDVTLEQAGAMLGFDPSYFCRLFKVATGATFTEYLSFVRVCRAEKMLTRGETSILCISEAVGFSSVSYFNRVFKRFRGYSPGAYRSLFHNTKRHKNKEEVL